MFSATGKILPGSVDRPAMATLINPPTDVGVDVDVDTQLITWNKLGYVPVVSTVTGCARALLGVIHSIVHLAAAIFDLENRSHHLKEAKLGGYNIGRGLIEAIPVIGNVALFVKDLVTAIKHNNIALEYRKNNSEECSKNVILFVDGKKVGQKSFLELGQITAEQKLTYPISFWKAVSLVQNKA